MAYPLNGGEIMEVTIRTQVFGQTVLNVLHYQCIMQAPVADGHTAVISFNEALTLLGGLTGPWSNVIPAEGLISEMRSQIVYPIRRPVAAKVLGIPGNRPGLALTANTAAVVTRRVADLAAKGRVGSLHIAPIATADQTAGQIQAAWGIAAQPLLDVLITARSIGGAGNLAVPVIWSRRHAAQPLTVAQQVTQATVRVMRRRTVGLGI